MRKIIWSIPILVVLTIFSATSLVGQIDAEKALFPVKVGGKHGFIDRSGKIVIAPRFDSLAEFADGRAVFNHSGEFGKLEIIDAAGNVITTQEWRAFYGYSEGLAAVGVGRFEMHGGGDHRFGFIDTNGKLVIDTLYPQARSFSEGLAAVANGEGKWGFIDKTGKVVIPFQFENAFGFSDGMACVLIDGLFGFVDKTGKVAIQPRFALPAKFSDDRASVEIAKPGFKAWTYYGSYGSSGGRMAVIDKTGAEPFALPKNVDKIGGFSEGLARVDIRRKKNDYYTGFIDTTGKLVIKLPFYTSYSEFSEGMCKVHKDNRYGFIDRTGKLVIQPIYSWAEDFHNGLASVSTSVQLIEILKRNPRGQYKPFNPNLGYIDKTGKVVWRPTK